MMLLAFDHTDDEAREIVLAVGVEAGHFGGFAANQRAAIVLAGIGDALDHFFGDVRLELAGGKVVHEEQRGGALHCDVVHTMVDQVRTHGVVKVHLESDFKLGAYAVDAGDQHGVEILVLSMENRPPNPPISLSTPLVKVLWARYLMRCLVRLARSMSTPASA